MKTRCLNDVGVGAAHYKVSQSNSELREWHARRTPDAEGDGQEDQSQQKLALH